MPHKDSTRITLLINKNDFSNIFSAAVSLQFDEGMPPHSKLDDILEKSKIYPLGRLYPFLQEVWWSNKQYINFI